METKDYREMSRLSRYSHTWVAVLREGYPVLSPNLRLALRQFAWDRGDDVEVLDFRGRFLERVID